MSFESNVAFHCAPTLAGIKPANLFSWRHPDRGCAGERVAGLADKIAGRGVAVETLCECGNYSLILVYREDMLARVVDCPKVREFLCGFGYARDLDLRGCLDKLKTRVKCHDSFPHEIGLFLGYPLHDVAAFIDAPNKHCSLRGEWKVYENEEDASKLFERFRKCRAELYARFLNGSDIAELVA